MKKIFIFIILGILLGSVFLFIARDKTETIENQSYPQLVQTEYGLIEKSYDLATKEISLSSDSTKAQILTTKLDTPQNYRVGAGYQKVAQFTISPKQDLSNVLGSFEFYDVNDNMKPITKQIDIQYLTTQQVSVDDYKDDCIDVVEKNGTRQVCSQVKSGSHFETREAWLPFDGNVKSNEPIIIGLFADVKIGESIEWIPIVSGVKISEWATWTNDLNVGLVAYYTFNDTTSVVDSSGNGNTGTNNGATNTSGILGSAYNFTGSQYVLLPNMTTFSTQATMNIWVKNNAWSQNNFLWAMGNNTAKSREVWQPSIEDIYSGTFRNDEVSNTSFSVFGANNTFHMVTITQTPGAAGWMFYYDGVSVWNETGENIVNIAPNGWNFNLGRSFDGGWIYGKFSMDEMGLWNRSLTQAEVTQLYNGGAGISWQANITIASLTITLISPDNNVNFTTNNVNFSVNVTPNNLLITNVSLLINGTIDQTNTSGLIGNYTFSKTLIDNSYNWTIIAYGNDSVRYNAINGTLFFNVDLIEPTVTLLSPANSSSTSITNISLNSTGTGNNYTLNNATLYLWFSNGTIFDVTTNSSLSNSTTINTSFFVILDGFTSYVWNVKYCGNATLASSCFFATDNFTFTFNPYVENSISYPTNVLETSRQTFIINISANPLVSAITGKFWYNGSGYTASITNPSSGIYISNDSIDIPLQNTGYSTNKSFFWQFDTTLTDSSSIQQNSTAYSHIVNRTYFELCNSTFITPLVNFTIKSAENPFPQVNATFKTGWNWFVSTGQGSIIRNTSFEDLNENKSTFNFCTSNYSTSFIMTSTINYDANLYSPNFYYLKNATLSNSTQNISLYLLNDSKATITTIQVREAAQQPIEDALVQIQLYDVGTNTYYTVSMAETNFDGKDVVYLNWYDSLYKFIILVDGEVVKSTQPYKVSETPQIFDIIDDISFSFEKFRDFQYSLVFNNVTDNFVLTYTKPSGLVDEACLRVIRRTAQNDTQICLTCQDSSSATLFCNIAGQQNGTYIAAFYATGSLDLVDWIVTTIGGNFAESIYEELGVQDATAYAILFGGLVFSLFLVTPVLGVLGILLGVLGASALGFATIDYLTYFGIVILGGILIWILKR